MANTLLLVTIVLSSVYFIQKAANFVAQLRMVRATGLPYVILPFFSFETLPRIFAPIWRPLLKSPYLPIPASVRSTWIMYLDDEATWHWQHEKYKELHGSPTMIHLTFAGNAMLTTADADVIEQVTQRKNDFWKPLRQYKLLDIYGKNVLSTEGTMWRKHRKVVGPPFTERNNHLVWSESLYSAQAMLDTLLNADGKSTRTVEDLNPLFGRLALAIISKAGYGVRLNWPRRDGKTVVDDDDTSNDPVLSREWVEGKTNGHTMSFGESALTLSERIVLLVLLPTWLLKALPFEATKEAASAYWNWGNYMREMIQAKKKHVSDIEPGKQSYDLLANLVKSAANSSKMLDSETAHTNGKSDKTTTEHTAKPADKFTDEEILGNAFLLIVAGHETSAGALQHLTLMLAMNPRVQRSLQSFLDATIKDTPPSTWDYETTFPLLFGGMPGAILAETLRLIPPVAGIPKMSKHATDLHVDGKACPLPANLSISIDIGAAQRNPRQWRHGQRNPGAPTYAGVMCVNEGDDLAEFKPERWLKEGLGADGNGSEEEQTQSRAGPTAEEKALGLNTSADIAPTLNKPRRGAYLPYMDGYRACMGRRFAQVEVMAIMALIFSRYTVELAVDEWANDDEVAMMGDQERRDTWKKAQVAAEHKFQNDMMMIITYQMRKGHIPVRFVRRGGERFNHLVE